MSSWSRRARPRVEWRSSPVARYDGHSSAWSWRETHRPSPMHRSTPSRRSPPSASNARPGAAGGRVVGRGRRRSAVSGSGRTMTPGLRTSPGSQIAFHSPNAATSAGLNWRAEQLAPGAAVAVLAAERPAVRDREVGGVRQEPREAVLAARPVEAEPRPQVEAALAEVAVDRALERVARASRPAELPDVPGEPVERGRRGPRSPGQAGVPSGSRADAARAVLPGPPQGGPLARVVEDERRRRSGAAARSPPRAARRGPGPRPASRRRPRRAARRRPPAAARRRRGPRAARGSGSPR